MEFIVRCFHQDGDDNVIGAEVVVYDGNNDAQKIILTDETLLNELIGRLDNLDTKYVDGGELKDALLNGATPISGKDFTINSDLLNGFQSDAFLKTTDTERYVFNPKKHDNSNGNLYGMGTVTNYGHVKLINNCNQSRQVAGEALAANQGWQLKKDITAVADNAASVETKRLHSRFTLIKRNGVVQLTIDNWDGLAWLNGQLNQWRNIFPEPIPEGFRPAPLIDEAKHIYCPNLFGYHLRVRINMDPESENKNHVQVYGDGADSHKFYGTITWITNE